MLIRSPGCLNICEKQHTKALTGRGAFFYIAYLKGGFGDKCEVQKINVFLDNIFPPWYSMTRRKSPQNQGLLGSAADSRR